MIAEVISIGTELLLGETQDTNSTFISSQLRDLGFEVFFRSTVGDNLRRMKECLSRALGRSDFVITTGGLGPTDGDITREVVAEVCKEKPSEDPKVLDWLVQLYQTRGYKMSPKNRRQAASIPSAEILYNDVGTAPGWFVRKGQKSIVCLPGPPHETEHMWKNQVLPLLNKNNDRLMIHTFHTLGIGESNIAEKLGELAQGGNPSVATYSRRHGVDIRVCSFAPNRKKANLLAQKTNLLKKRGNESSLPKKRDSSHSFGMTNNAVISTGGRNLFYQEPLDYPELLRSYQKTINLIGEMFKHHIYGENGETICSAILGRLSRRKQTLAVFEGVSQGKIAGLLSQEDKFKNSFCGSFVGTAKIFSKLTIGTLVEKRMTAAQQAEKLAKSAREVFCSDWGIANLPGPSFEQKDVCSGKSYIAITGPGKIEVHSIDWPSTTGQFCQRVANFSLYYLWRMIAKKGSQNE